MAAVCIHSDGIRCEERPAAHASVHFSFETLHHLRTNIVRHHAFCCALGSKLGESIILRSGIHVILVKHIDQFRECRGDPYTGLILHTFDPLLQHFLDHNRKVIPKPSFRYFI